MKIGSMIKSLSLVIIMLTAVFTLNVSAERESAHKVVEKATDELLEKLREIEPLYETDKVQFFAEVEYMVAPFIDFEGFSRGVMAKYYRRATDEQQRRFIGKFKESLIRTYGDTLVGFDGQNVEILEPSGDNPDSDRASVKLKIHGSGGEVYSVIYTLVDNDGEWKLRNLTVEGINLGLQFRSQFAGYMQQHGNDIEKVIEYWGLEDSDPDNE